MIGLHHCTAHAAQNLQPGRAQQHQHQLQCRVSMPVHGCHHVRQQRCDIAGPAGMGCQQGSHRTAGQARQAQPGRQCQEILCACNTRTCRDEPLLYTGANAISPLTSLSQDHFSFIVEDGRLTVQEETTRQTLAFRKYILSSLHVQQQ